MFVFPYEEDRGLYELQTHTCEQLPTDSKRHFTHLPTPFSCDITFTCDLMYVMCIILIIISLLILHDK